MSSFNDFVEEVNSWIAWAENMCDYFKDEYNGCDRNCPCTKVDDEYHRCLLSLSVWLKTIRYGDWAKKLIEDADCLHEPNINWETERSQLMEICDRLTAENDELKRNIAKLEHKDIENRILRDKLTQEVLTNLEMQIVLDTQEFYREANKDADFCF